MKKVFLAFALALISMGAMAQSKGDIAAGVKLLYGTEVKNIGAGARFQYMLTDNLRGEGSFDYFFEKHDVNMWNINANVHYLCPVGETTKVYPLLGVGIANAYTDMVHNSIHFCMNLGAGIQQDLATDLAIDFEAKYQFITHHSQFVAAIGVVYKF